MEPLPTPSTPWFADKSFWLAVLTPFAGLIALKFGVQINVEALVALITPIITYIVASKASNASKYKALAAAEAQKAGQAASGGVNQ